MTVSGSKYAADGEEIRNGYGSNVSYLRDMFLAVGGYDVHTGRKGDRHIQAHEAPVGIRIREAYGQGVVYVEDAVVHHTLFAYRGKFGWLLFRSFWQGYSKTILEAWYPRQQQNERVFVSRLVREPIPTRLGGGAGGTALRRLLELISILSFTLAIAAAIWSDASTGWCARIHPDVMSSGVRL